MSFEFCRLIILCVCFMEEGSKKMESLRILKENIELFDGSSSFSEFVYHTKFDSEFAI